MCMSLGVTSTLTENTKGGIPLVFAEAKSLKVMKSGLKGRGFNTI